MQNERRGSYLDEHGLGFGQQPCGQLSLHLDRHLAMHMRRKADEVLQRRPEVADAVERLYWEGIVGLRNGLWVLEHVPDGTP